MDSNEGNKHSLYSRLKAFHSEAELNELVQILYFQPVYTILCGHAIAVLITVIFLWDSVAIQWLIPWAIIICGQTLIWMTFVARFRREPHASHNTSRALRIFPMAGAVTGALWGATLYWPNVMHDTTSIVFLSVMVLGVTAAGLAVYAPYLRSFSIFAGFTLVPFSIRFFMEGDRLSITLGVMFLLYFGVLLISGINMRRAVGQAITLRLENTGLIDDLKNQFNQAERARDDAEKANVSKSKFLAAASHDLRQPLHALGLFVDALESRVNSADQEEIVDNIRISTDALRDLLNALLDISKLDAGVLEPQIGVFQLQPIFRRIQNDFEGSAAEKSLRLRVVDSRCAVRTDPAMLERILLNLVSNAIRYTNQGSVLMGCRRSSDSVSIEVHDTGIGIAEEELKHIFEEFYQVENTERDRSKGLGLGLAIVRRQADLLACSLTVSSGSRGSVFRIKVPIATASHALDATPGPYVSDLQGTRVLIIDDESLIRRAMREVLETWHCQVFEAESAEQALQRFCANETFDIILCDFRLREGKTGIEAINLIHAYYGQPIPAIILTGDTSPKRLRDTKASGFKLLHKPVSSAKLRSLMSYLLENRVKSPGNFQ